MHESEKWKWSHSVVSDSLRPHGLQPTRLLHPWDSPGKSTGLGCHCLLHDESRQSIKKQRHHFAYKSQYSQSYVFSNSHVGMWQLIHKEGWALKNWCFGTVVLEKTLESSVDCKEIKLGNLKGNPPWLFIGRTDAEDEPPIFWSPDVKGWLTGKDPDTEKDWGQEEKGATEDKMVGLHLRLNSYEFEQTLIDCEGQGSLACCSPWYLQESDMT